MTEILKQFNQKPIAYYPIYRKLTGSTTAGLLLSQLMYWFAKKDKFHKTDAEIMEETLLGKKELENAKKVIKKLPFIAVTREGVPAKTYYEIDWKKLEESLKNLAKSGETSSPEAGKQDSTKGGNCAPRKGETNKGKSFDTETTTETTTEKEKTKAKKKAAEPENLPEPLAEWVTYRKQIKKPLKPPSIDKLMAQYRNDPEAFKAKVEFSIANGYQGLFAPSRQRKPERPENMRDMIDRVWDKYGLDGGEAIDTEVCDG